MISGLELDTHNGRTGGEVNFLGSWKRGLVLASAVFLFAAGVHAQGTQEGSRILGTTAPPVINVWYGNSQPFKKIGTPQRWVNILGNIPGYNPLESWDVHYQLNGGPIVYLTLGPNTRRLSRQGDFNIDIGYNQLVPGSNTISIYARNPSWETTTTSVTVTRENGGVWPLPYSVNLASFNALRDSTQVVDGKWGRVANGVRILEPGYDRMVAIGDTSWSDYEVKAEVTIHGLDSVGFRTGNSGCGVGFLFRWEGHTDQPAFIPPSEQPKEGYLPLGAIGWYLWREPLGKVNEWQLATNTTIDPPKDYDTRPELTPLFDTLYYFKMRVITNPGQGGYYTFKAWRASQPEPPNFLVGQESLFDPQNGCLTLLAHMTDVTFGKVWVTAAPSDNDPPVISGTGNSPDALSAVITWQTNEPASSTVLFGPTSSYGQYVTDPVQVTNHSVVINNLSPTSTYHFKVMSQDVAGNVSASFDEILSTTVLPPPTVPSLLAPADGVTGQPTTTTLRWSRPRYATSFRVGLATTSDFSAGIVLEEVLGDTQRTVSGLASGEEFFWRVQSINASGQSSYSVVRSFQTDLAAPVLVSPANNATMQPLSLTLRWRHANQEAIYHVQLSTDPAMTSNLIVNDAAVTDTLRNVSGLANNVKYYWRVASRTPHVIGTFSAVWNFTTTPPLPSIPVLLSPPASATDQPLQVQCVWGKVSGATSYHMQFGTAPSFASGVLVNDSTLADTTRLSPSLNYNTAYYWRARAKNAAGYGSWSAARSLTTIAGVPDSPFLVSPVNGSTGQPTSNLLLRWRKVSDALSYHLQMATDSTFVSGIIKNDSTVVDTARSVSGLSIFTQYYWRVAARNTIGQGSYSPAWRLQTYLPLPSKVLLVAPTNLSEISADSVRLSWNSSGPQVVRYWLEVTIDSTFTFVQADSSIADTEKVYRPVAPQTTYFWRVRAYNSAGWGQVSDTRRFRNTTTTVNPDRSIPGAYLVKQNYPNPFNPSTTIEFGIPKESAVRLEVYNALGERVGVLLERTMGAGYHSVVFDAGGLPSGIYFYRLLGGDVNVIKKMMLVR